MGERMTCPACGSHTSGVLTAYHEQDPCPVCDLSYEATDAVLEARSKTANADLIAQVSRLTIDNDRLARSMDVAAEALRSARDTLERATDALDGVHRG